MSARRSGPPKHQNETAWVPSRNDKHNSLRKLVSALPNQGVCARCHEQIEWKKQYGKYKPLKQPGKCTGCGHRNVEHAYHALCQGCCSERRVCAKCLAAAPLPKEKTNDELRPLERKPDAAELAEMNERERRTALRKVDKAKRERKAAERAAREAAEGGGAEAMEEEEAKEDDDDTEEEEEEVVAAAPVNFTKAAAEARAKAHQLAKAAANDPIKMTWTPPTPAAAVMPDVSDAAAVAMAPEAAPPIQGGSTASFIPAERFEGAKPGYAFRNGESGNGYYRDEKAPGYGAENEAYSPIGRGGAAAEPPTAATPPPAAAASSSANATPRGSRPTPQQQLPERQTSKHSAPTALGHKRCRNVDDFEKLAKIGEGTFGDVYKARDRKTNDIVALKQVKMSHPGQEGFPQTALREINILLSLSHTHVINAREMVVGDTYDKIFMVMEFMEHDLKQLMQAMKQPFTEAEVKRLMLDLTSAMEYCHDRWVFHRDLKTSNLLMNNKGEVSICDFGLARYYHEPPQGYSPTVVTLWYRAPEVLLSDTGEGIRTTYGPAIDIWSLGCIFAELVLTQPLLAGQGEIDQVKRIFELLGTPDDESWPGHAELHYFKKVKPRRQPFNRLKDKFKKVGFAAGAKGVLSEAGVDLLNKMLILNPAKRITAKEALKHKYFTEDPQPKAHDMMPTFPSTHKTPARQPGRR